MRVIRYLALFTFSSLLLSVTAQAQQGVCVYKDSNFEGPRRCFENNVSSFKKLGINDQVSSFQIHGGVNIIFYEHSGYKGSYKKFSNGQAVLRDGMNDNFSSMKIVAAPKPAQWGDRGNWGNQNHSDPGGNWNNNEYNTENPYGQPTDGLPTADPFENSGLPGQPAQVCLYSNQNYSGKSYCFSSDNPRFSNFGFDNQADSMRIEGDIEVELFQHTNYKGFSRIYRKNIARFSPQEHDQYSAIRIRKRSNNSDPNLFPAAQACLYPDRNYGGQPYCFNSDNARFADFGFDNKADSLRLQGNIEAVLYQHENYTGYSRVFRNNIPKFKGKDHDQFSSIKIRYR